MSDTPREEIRNTWDQCVAAGGDRVFIAYSANGGRSVLPAWWAVYRIKDGQEVPTKPLRGAWYEYGRQTFTGRVDGLIAAKAWVAEHIGPREFVRNRLGDYVEREVNEKYPLKKRAAHV